MASPYTPICQDVVATGTVNYTQIMGSVYMVNNGANNVTISFDNAAGGTFTMAPGDAVNLENIQFKAINFVFAGASIVPLTAVPRGS